MTRLTAGIEKLRQLDSQKLLVGIALTLAILAASALVIRARETSPISGCFDGLLDQHPVHCAVFEDLHNNETVRIEAIYESGAALFVFVEQSGSISEGDYGLIKDRARTELAATGWHNCVADLYENFGCEFGVLRGYGGGRLLPPMAEWNDIILVTGGEAALRDQAGWASMHKRWPATSTGTAEPRSVRSTTTAGFRVADEFDISDVNLTDNFDPVDCSELVWTSRSCDWWERHPELGLAGVFYYDNDPKTYFQIKAPAGADDPAIAAARTAIVAAGYGISESDFIAIPVNYDYADLWRWAQILERFTLSAGNTIGMTIAHVGDNIGWNDARTVYPASDVVDYEPGSPELVRTTIAVGTRELERTVAALPRLLGQLGIPAEAVGLVVENDFKPFGIARTEPDFGSMPPPSP